MLLIIFTTIGLFFVGANIGAKKCRFGERIVLPEIRFFRVGENLKTSLWA